MVNPEVGEGAEITLELIDIELLPEPVVGGGWYPLMLDGSVGKAEVLAGALSDCALIGALSVPTVGRVSDSLIG